MSATLIAVLLALLLGHVAKPLARLRRHEWFDAWLDLLRARAARPMASSWGILLTLAPPLLLLHVLQCLLSPWLYGIPGFLFALAVLIYCWGPRDLDLDVEAIIEARDPAARASAMAALAEPGQRLTDDDTVGLIAAVFGNARRRWFGVLFWFLLLGPLGALLYRLTERGQRAGQAQRLPAAQALMYQRLLRLLDWPVAHLMAAALALVANFDAVAGAWRHWYRIRRGRPFDFSAGFLDAAALAATEQSQRQTNARPQTPAAELHNGNDAVAAPPPLPALETAMTLIWRILIAWLTLIALFVLAGYA